MSSHHGQSWFNIRRWRLIALLAALASGCSILLAQSGGAEDPLPVQRIFIKPERAAKEMEKVQQGALLRFPRQEFEDRLERLRQAQQARMKKPHLARAHYSAELIGRSLTTGSGRRSEWTILHTGDAASILPMDPLNLALAKVNWEHGGDAILAELDGKSLGLLVKHSGKAMCLFDWSARGTPTNDGIAFSLAIPPCPISTFEFKLPADSWLAAPKGGAIVTGPHEADAPNKRLWRIQATGSKPIEILVRQITETKDGFKPTLFARVQSTQQIAPDRLAVDHELQLDILHGSVHQLILEADGGLQPYAVLLPGVEVKSWRWEESAAPKDAKDKSTAASGLLTIDFQQPVQGRIQGLRVRSLMSRSSKGLWTSPMLRVRNALSRGETLDVRLHPDLGIGKWDHGSFQPTSISTEPDGTQKLLLAETAADADELRRPSLVLPVKGIDLHTTEDYLWQLSPRGATLAAEIHYALARGHLFELRIKLPKALPGYQIEALEMQPGEMLGDWHPDGGFLVVELKQPLTPAKKAMIKIQMRSGFREMTTGTRILNYPELEPIDGTKREGTLAIEVDPIFRSQLVNSSVPLAPHGVEIAGERDKRPVPPSYRFMFRDQRLTAAVQLVPQPVQVQLQGKHTVTLSDQAAALQFRWEAQPLVGAPEFLDFRFAPGFPSAWKVNVPEDTLRIHHWERLHLQEALPHLLQFGSGNGLHAAALESMLPAGTYWRFHLAEPLRRKAGFTLQANAPAGMADDEWRRVSLLLPNAHPWECIGGALADAAAPPSSGAKVWSVPLMTPVQRSNVELAIAVDSPGEPISKLGSVGMGGSLQPYPASLQPDKATNQLQLHQAGDNHEPASTILLWTRPEKRLQRQLELCDEAKLTTFLAKDGRNYHRIEFRLWHWRTRVCELRLPAGFQVLAVKVHDHWLQHLDAVASPREDAQVRLTLPYNQNAAFVRYEIFTRGPSQAFSLPGMLKVEAPVISWPVAPLDYRYRINLEKGWTPLDPEALTRVGLPVRIAKQTQTSRLLREIWSWGSSWLPYGAQADLLGKMESQKQIVLSAEAQWRGGAGKTVRLSEALERLALHHLKDRAPLVIDAIACRSLGVTPDTACTASGRPFWESLGLVYLPCPSGALLTSSRRLQELGIDGSSSGAELDGTIQEAILHSRDASSGFYLVPSWLTLPATQANAFMGESIFPGSEHFGESLHTTEWEILMDGSRSINFYVIDAMVARILGWLLAALAALLLWRVQRALEPLACFRAYVLLLTASILIVLWSPVNVREFFVFPAFIVVTVGFVWCVGRFVGLGGLRAPSGPSTLNYPKAPSMTNAVLGLAALAITWSVAAQAPAPRSYPVFVIDGPKQAVLVTPDLIAKMEELEKQSALGTPGAVLVSAKYTGKVNGARATFDVQYEIYSFKDKANLVIPLAGVQLGEGAFLDGTPVYPAPHKNGYVLPIRGTGLHHLRLSFSDRAVSENDHHNLRFTIPKLIQNEITLQWQTPVHDVQAQHSRGEEKTVTDPRKAVKEWHANLGYENVVHLRWTTTLDPSFAKAIEVKEAHFWDLRPGALALVTSLNYSIGKGSLAQLSVALPEGLHVRSVEALTAIPAPPIFVKHWRIVGTGDQRSLTVDFVQPAAGNLTLNLEIVPQSFPQKNKLLLPLPAPQQGKSIAGLVAYRLDATEIRPAAQNLDAVQSINAEDFEQLWKKQNAPSLSSGPPISRAYTFQRKASKARLELTIQPNDRQAQFHLQWHVDHHFADLQGKFTISSSHEDLILLEFFIDPAMTLADVAGPDVRRWHLHDSLLQVWLRQPRRETTLRMTGWRTAPAKAPAPAKKSFVLPCIYPLHTQIGAASLEVRPAARIHLEVERTKFLRAKSPETLHFTIEKTPYEASFRLAVENKPPEASMLTKVQRTAQGIDVWHGIRVTTQRGQLPTIQLHLKDWPHEAMRLDAPDANQLILNKSLKHPSWTLKYPSMLPQEVFITLRGRVPQDKHTSISLPVIELDDVTIRRHWLAWKDVEITSADSGKKLLHDKSVKETAVPYQFDGWFKDLPTWNHAKAGPSLKAALSSTPVGASVRIVASSESLRRSGARRWLHEASYWVHAPEGTELRLKFPAPVEAFNFWTDQRQGAASNPSAQEFILPVEANPRPRLVELRWRYAEIAERTDAPSIAALQIDSVLLPAHQRIVWVPLGTFAAQHDGKPTLLPRLVHQAQGHMRLAAALAVEPARPAETSKAIAERQQHFHACVNQAEYALSILKYVQTDFEAASWLERLGDLKRKNAELAKELRYDEQRSQAEKTKSPLVDESTDEHSTTGIPLLLSPNLPSLTLQSAHARALSVQRTRSELFLLGAIFVLVFSYFRHGWVILRMAVPELTIGLAALALGLFGMSLIGILLVGAMIVVRSFSIAAFLQRRFASSTALVQETKSPSSVQQPPAQTGSS